MSFEQDVLTLMLVVISLFVVAALYVRRKKWIREEERVAQEEMGIVLEEGLHYSPFFNKSMAFVQVPFFFTLYGGTFIALIVAPDITWASLMILSFLGFYAIYMCLIYTKAKNYGASNSFLKLRMKTILGPILEEEAVFEVEEEMMIEDLLDRVLPDVAEQWRAEVAREARRGMTR